MNAVAPGATVTDMLDAVRSPDFEAHVVARTPLGRLGRPEDSADVIAFLASEESGWVTGQVIAASGGLRL